MKFAEMKRPEALCCLISQTGKSLSIISRYEKIRQNMAPEIQKNTNLEDSAYFPYFLHTFLVSLPCENDYDKPTKIQENYTKIH